ncbi:unnamed protein product [Eretmochelys imbricata]
MAATSCWRRPTLAKHKSSTEGHRGKQEVLLKVELLGTVKRLLGRASRSVAGPLSPALEWRSTELPAPTSSAAEPSPKRQNYCAIMMQGMHNARATQSQGEWG